MTFLKSPAAVPRFLWNSPLLWPWLACVVTLIVLVLGTDAFSRTNVQPVLAWLSAWLGWEGWFVAGDFASAEEGWLRKSAHFLEYALLAILWLQSIRVMRPGWPLWRCIVIAFSICVVVAILDELQQGFIATDRSGSPRDVLLDAAGAATALLIAKSIFFARVQHLSS